MADITDQVDRFASPAIHMLREREPESGFSVYGADIKSYLQIRYSWICSLTPPGDILWLQIAQDAEARSSQSGAPVADVPFPA